MKEKTLSDEIETCFLSSEDFPFIRVDNVKQSIKRLKEEIKAKLTQAPGLQADALISIDEIFGDKLI